MPISKQANSKYLTLKGPARRSRQAGYSLLMVVFMVATILVLAAAASTNVLTEGRRERETEMVWRGEQYERAIGLYYKKFGKYPTKIDDLTKQTNGVRFLRQAYTDPMNKDDGSWRFIYIGPNGQLIGSLKSTSLLQSATTPTTGFPGSSGLGAGLGAAIGSLLGGGTQSTPGTGVAPGPPGAGTTNAGTSGTGTPGASQTGQQSTDDSSSSSLESQPQPLEGAVLGGNIIGVGSKIKQPSLLIYQGGNTYQKWEFVWNPLQQTAIPGQGPVGPTSPQATQNPSNASPGSQPPATTTPGAPPPDTPPPTIF